MKGYNSSDGAANTPTNPASGGTGISSSGWLFLQCLNNYCPVLDGYAPGYGISTWFQQLWKVYWLTLPSILPRSRWDCCKDICAVEFCKARKYLAIFQCTEALLDIWSMTSNNKLYSQCTALAIIAEAWGAGWSCNHLRLVRWLIVGRSVTTEITWTAFTLCFCQDNWERHAWLQNCYWALAILGIKTLETLTSCAGPSLGEKCG